MILPGDSPQAIEQCARHLRGGGLVGLPTETVYGLAANAHDDAAVARIFAAKGRPADHPLIIHVAGVQALGHFAHGVPAYCTALLQAFWPGPLTVVLRRNTGMAMAASGGHGTIALRCPAHPVAQALLAKLADAAAGGACWGSQVWGLAAPSANRFGKVSPTTAQHVAEEFGEAFPVLDGGPCAVGIESTIVDCTHDRPVLLRPGVLTGQALHEACGVALAAPTQAQQPVRAPGTLASHYAPRARVRLLEEQALRDALHTLPPTAAQRVAVWSRWEDAPTAIRQCTMPDVAAEAARQLFAVLRNYDAEGVEEIWVQTVPDSPEWEGVRDRLQRAAATWTHTD
ncbi:L-threonylcarbamoyladenylate synthase [Candidatus Symbiobacter mobilis]|uniref:Threonylcarbamoyl-AMP synthase n=1 Tax=Candidatus Symbiobacter mobilis CR TaxID=946483 RepID=U5NBJ8_9BURK|nr:L-threonylcarbamoyladenylate synthase [Candidatus Symbiobacter mobilis]AGX87549.1 translation factor-like protein [Candidatus Symbiobacter mobilis CR]